MAKQKLNTSQTNSLRITQMGTFSTGSLNSGANQNVSVSITTEPDTNYKVFVQIVTNGAYYTDVIPTIQSKTTSGFTAGVFNRSVGTAAAATWDYIVVRS